MTIWIVRSSWDCEGNSGDVWVFSTKEAANEFVAKQHPGMVVYEVGNALKFKESILGGSITAAFLPVDIQS